MAYHEFMYIAHICSELAPLAKVGGLADVVYGLSKALIAEGHSVDIILPKYDCLDYSVLKDVIIDCRSFWSYEGYQRFNNTVWRALFEGINIFLLEPQHPSFYFSRGVIYGCPDDIDRFLYFSRASLEYLFKTKKTLDILHLHDWPSALIATLYRDMYVPLGMSKCRTVLTIHNIEHQGRCTVDQLSKAGLLGESYLTEERMLDPVYPHTINILKGGIESADAITTVSPTYEDEIMLPENSFGLSETMKKNKNKLTGILNGIDIDTWNPSTDPFLIKHYDATNAYERQNAKKENRQALHTQHGLKISDQPLVTCVTRLVSQKGPALIKEAILHTLELGGQFILLGSSPSGEILQDFTALKTELNEQNAHILLDYNEAIAHLIYASADMLMIPSIFEPCGLTQMIALRYGTIPIARRTGGLADTVFDLETSEVPLQQRNGFTFDAADAAGVRSALDRAFQCFQNKPADWKQLIDRAARADFSWKRSAKEYVKVYKSTTRDCVLISLQD